MDSKSIDWTVTLSERFSDRINPSSTLIFLFVYRERESAVKGTLILIGS